MRYFIENNDLKVEIDSFGAEVKSVLNKHTYREYMWYGNKKYWGRTSPVLFPFVGSLADKRFIWQGYEYPMGQHGFARDNEFKKISQTEDEIWFSLQSDLKTLSMYPFPFDLRIGYKLEEGSKHLKVFWEVFNPGDQTMYFSIGAHPAFLVPTTGEDGSMEGNYLEFEGVEEIHYHGNDRKTGLSLEEDLILKLEDGRVKISKDFFDRSTYMVEGKQTGSVSILDAKGQAFVKVSFDAPLFAIWSPEEKNAPFLCIEPWYGRCDSVGFEGELQERPFTNVLKARETFLAGYEIEFM